MLIDSNSASPTNHQSTQELEYLNAPVPAMVFKANNRYRGPCMDADTADAHANLHFKMT